MKDITFKSDDLLFATFDILRKSETSLHIKEIDEKVSQKLNLTTEQLAVEHTANRSKYEYRMAWTRTELKSAGLIENIASGMWICSYEGYSLEEYDKNIVRELTRKLKEKSTVSYRSIMLKKMCIRHRDKDILNVDFFIEQEAVPDNIYSIIISENGSGKSFTLAQICMFFSAYESYLRDENVEIQLKYEFYYCTYRIGNDNIGLEYKDKKWKMCVNGQEETNKGIIYLPGAILALTHTLSDKFPFSKLKDNENFYYYLGPKNSHNTVNLTEIENKLIMNLANIFKYGDISIINKTMSFIGYDDSITINIPKEILSILENRYKQLYSTSGKINTLRQVEQQTRNYKISTEKNYTDFDKNTFFQIANELTLIFENISEDSQVDIFLFKQDEAIKYQWLSSGEKMIIESVLSMGAFIDSEAIVLIDEPENSLHPKWQSDFVPLIEEVFLKSKNKLHVVIATHSPNIVLRAPDCSSTIISIDNDKGIRSYCSNEKATNNLTLEEVLYREFEFTNYRSIPLENDMVTIIKYIQEQKTVDDNYLKTLERITKNTKTLSSHSSLKIFVREADKYVENQKKTN